MGIVDNLLMVMVRVAVLGILKSWTPADFRFAIEKKVSLAAVIKSQPTYYEKFRGFAQQSPDWAETFTVEYVLTWLRDRRPDLYEVASSIEGRAWLDTQVQDLRRVVWSDKAEEITETEKARLEATAWDYIELNPEALTNVE